MTVVLPLLLVGIAFAVAARFHERIPTRLKIYRFHAIAYPLVTILGLAAVAMMRLSPSLDWWVDDSTVFLELLFGISGSVLCILLVPVVGWLGRRPDPTKTLQIGRGLVSTLTLAPYFLIAGILLFYRE